MHETPWTWAQRGSESVPVRWLQNWAEHQGENKTLFLPQHTTPVSLCVCAFPPLNQLMQVPDVCSLNLEWMIKAGGGGLGRGKGAQTERALRYHTLPPSPTLILSACKRCSQTQTNSRSRALHKEHLGTNHHNNLSLTYLKYHLNIRLYQKQMELMSVCSASFSIRSDVCRG